jgi:hypothetical protein
VLESEGMRMDSKSCVPVEIVLIAVTLLLIAPPPTATAQVVPTTTSKPALMPLPSSISRGEGALTVTPGGGGGSTFTYRYDQTHDARLEAAVKRALLQLGRTCGGASCSGECIAHHQRSQAERAGADGQ